MDSYSESYQNGGSRREADLQGLSQNIGTNIGGASNFAIGCKYALDKDASLRAKVDTNSQIGLSYQQKLREGIVVTVSTNLDGTKLNQPGHKLGLCLEMSA